MTDATPTSYNNKVDDLIFICERLSLLLEKENAALVNKNDPNIGDLLEEKQMLCGAYELRGKALLEDPAQLAKADEELRLRLLELVKDVEEKIAVNAHHLSIQIEVSRRFFNVLADAAREHAPNAGTYSSSGATDTGPIQAPKGLPLSIDQTL